MLDFARTASVDTDGVFNITVGASLNRLGYGETRRAGVVSADFWDHVEMSHKGIRIPETIQLDFGGFGKGWLIDTFVEYLRSKGYESFIVNGGGDLYVASTQPVKIALEDPYTTHRTIGSVWLRDSALAASSSLKRTWCFEGETRHHIIDPSQDASSTSNVVASFVIASEAKVADMLATVLIVRPELEARLRASYTVTTKLVSQRKRPHRDEKNELRI